MVEPARQFTATNSTGYRFGFNGKEKSDEIEGSGVDYDYGARIYDARAGKFLSVDPMNHKYPSETPYHFGGNNPINYADIGGADTIKFCNLSTIYPPLTSNLDGLVKAPGVTVTNKYLITPAKGKDVFLYIVVRQMVSANGTVSTPYHQETRFYPNNGFADNGVYDDDDGDLIAFRRICPADLATYLELKDPKEYGGLKLDIAFQHLSDKIQFVGRLTIAVLAAGESLEFSDPEEAVAFRDLSLQEQESGGHFLSRHGAQTSLSSQYKRAISGLTPDGELLEETDASRFLSHRKELDAVNAAKARYAKTGEKAFTMEMKQNIGEGYLEGGGKNSYKVTSKVRAVFDNNGKLKTLYPVLR